MTRTYNNFRNVIFIFTIILICGVFVGSANAGVHHDMDRNLSNGAELDVDDPWGGDVANLSIPANEYYPR